MNPAINVIAYAFYGLAVVLGMPGAAYLVYDGSRRIRRKLFPKPAVTVRSSPNADGLLEIFEKLSIGIAAVSKVGGFVSEIVAGIFAGLAISGVLVGTLLFFTARGLLHQEPWARYTAGVLFLNVGLLALLSALTSGKRRPKRVIVSLLITVASGFVLHALWQGYSAA